MSGAARSLREEFSGLVGMKPHISELAYRHFALDTRALGAATDEKKDDIVDHVVGWSQLGALLMQAHRFDDGVEVVNAAEIADVADDNVMGSEAPASREARLFLDGIGLISFPSAQFGITLMRCDAIPSRSRAFSISRPRATLVVAERSDWFRNSRSKRKRGRAGAPATPSRSATSGKRS